MNHQRDVVGGQDTNPLPRESSGLILAPTLLNYIGNLKIS